MGTLVMKTNVEGIFLPRLPLIKLFSLYFLQLYEFFSVLTTVLIINKQIHI